MHITSVPGVPASATGNTVTLDSKEFRLTESSSRRWDGGKGSIARTRADGATEHA
jgi:hypothetical protein